MRTLSNSSESGKSTAEFEDDQGNHLEIQVDDPINKPSTDLTANDWTVSVEDVDASKEAKARVLKWHTLKPSQRTPQQIREEEDQVLEDYARMVRPFVASATEADHKKDKQRKPGDWYVVWRAFDSLVGNRGQMAKLVNQKSSLWGEALAKGWIDKIKELWPEFQPPARDNRPNRGRREEGPHTIATLETKPGTKAIIGELRAELIALLLRNDAISKDDLDSLAATGINLRARQCQHLLEQMRNLFPLNWPSIVLGDNLNSTQLACNENALNKAQMGDKGLALSTQLAEEILSHIKATGYNLSSVDYPMDDDDQDDTDEPDSGALISHFFKTKKVPLDLDPTVDHSDDMLVLIKLYNQLHAAERARLGASEPSLPALPLSDQNAAEKWLQHRFDDEELAALKGERTATSTAVTAKSKLELKLIEAVQDELAAVRQTTPELRAQTLEVLKQFQPLKWETAANLEPAIGAAGGLQSNLGHLTELGFAAGGSTIQSKHWTVSFPARREQDQAARLNYQYRLKVTFQEIFKDAEALERAKSGPLQTEREQQFVEDVRHKTVDIPASVEAIIAETKTALGQSNTSTFSAAAWNLIKEPKLTKAVSSGRWCGSISIDQAHANVYRVLAMLHESSDRLSTETKERIVDALHDMIVLILACPRPGFAGLWASSRLHQLFCQDRQVEEADQEGDSTLHLSAALFLQLERDFQGIDVVLTTHLYHITKSPMILQARKELGLTGSSNPLYYLHALKMQLGRCIGQCGSGLIYHPEQSRDKTSKAWKRFISVRHYYSRGFDYRVGNFPPFPSHLCLQYVFCLLFSKAIGTWLLSKCYVCHSSCRKSANKSEYLVRAEVGLSTIEEDEAEQTDLKAAQAELPSVTAPPLDIKGKGKAKRQLIEEPEETHVSRSEPGPSKRRRLS